MPPAPRHPAALLLALLAGCAPAADEAGPAAPARQLADAADSLAARIENAAGGAAAFAALPALRFDFAVVGDEGETSRRRHLWNRVTGEYRLEWATGPDSQYVALFTASDVTGGRPAAGRVYLNGEPADSTATEAALMQSYRRFINDMYWLLAPLKLFDEGVRRRVEADSADARTEVLAVSFDSVGLTPGDRYWLHADRESGRLVGWTYWLEGGTRNSYTWGEPQDVAGPGGALHLNARKASTTGGSTILTPAEAGLVDDSSFVDRRPRLAPLGATG